jgi:hypothetical protein
MHHQETTYDAWIGHDAYDQSGEKVGEITDIFYDDQTGRPEWVGVKTGLFGSKTTFVPIHGSTIHTGDSGDGEDDSLRLAFAKDFIKDAPRIDIDEDHMDPAEEQRLWSYYGYDYGQRQAQSYGPNYGTSERADKDFSYRRYDRNTNQWGPPTAVEETRRTADTDRVEEHTEEVPVKTTAQVEVPVDTTVRLRRYQTQEQKTRTVEVPYTETTEHTEVAGVDARAGQPTRTSGAAEVGETRTKPR